MAEKKPVKPDMADKKTVKPDMADKKPAKTVKAAKPKTGRSLVIVESPTKEKTIGRFLDSNYVVRSSFGHVRDLPKDELGVDEKGDFAAKCVPVTLHKVDPRASDLSKAVPAHDQIN